MKLNFHLRLALKVFDVFLILKTFLVRTFSSGLQLSGTFSSSRCPIKGPPLWQSRLISWVWKFKRFQSMTKTNTKTNKNFCFRFYFFLLCWPMVLFIGKIYGFKETHSFKVYSIFLSIAYFLKATKLWTEYIAVFKNIKESLYYYDRTKLAHLIPIRIAYYQVEYFEFMSAIINMNYLGCFIKHIVVTF